jgi:hypothetical protein
MAAPPQRYFCRPLMYLHSLSRRAHAFDCTLLYATPEQLPALLACFEAVREHARTMPGLVLRMLLQDEAEPTRFVSVRGWESEAAREAADRDLVPRLDAEFRAQGTIAERFTARMGA